MRGPSELSWLLNFMGMVAVCDAVLSLTVWTTVFRVNS